MATTAIYITDTNQVGFRPNKFDWVEGERILTADGDPCIVVKVVDTNSYNLITLKQMINTCNRFTTGAPITKTVHVCGLKVQRVIGEKRWKSVEAKLSYVYATLENIN